MEQTLPTRGEIERSLSQYIQAFYRDRLGCRTDKVSCYILKNQVTIAIENSITPVETLLSSSNDDRFRQDLRYRIDAIIKNELHEAIASRLSVSVLALTINTTLERNFTGIVVLLAGIPPVRTPKGDRRTRE
jgi:uncharacterized protein YbcI